MAGFSMPGLGAGGMDFASMIDQIRQAEQSKLTPYTNKKAKYTSQVSSWGKISGALSAVSDNLDKIGDEGFHGVNVSSNKAFKATATAGAQPDSYGLYVEQLARSHKIGSAGQASKTEPLGDSNVATRTLNIRVGKGEPLAVELSADQTSLEQMAKQINRQKGGVSASVRPTDSGGYTLVLTAKKTGEHAKISVDVDGDPALAAVMNYDPAAASGNAMTQLTAPKNAVIVIDGTRLERESNTITDAVEGLTLELQQVSEKESNGDFIEENLSVTSDTRKLKTSLEEFVKLYNAFITETSAASAWKAPSDDSGRPNPANGALMGDGSLRRLTGDMREVMASSNSALSPVFASLASIGIEVKIEDAASGRLTLDSKKLANAIKENPDDIEALFLGKGEAPGLADRLQEVIKTWIGDKNALPRSKGLIEQITRGMKEQSTQIDSRISQMQKNIDATVERSRRDFERLDMTMSKMNNMSSQLAAMLATL